MPAGSFRSSRDEEEEEEEKKVVKNVLEKGKEAKVGGEAILLGLSKKVLEDERVEVGLPCYERSIVIFSTCTTPCAPLPCPSISLATSTAASQRATILIHQQQVSCAMLQALIK